MEVLQGVASLGVTVVAVLHQPRYEIFAMFDTLLLLGAGRTVFMGPTLSAVRYFQSLDYVCHPLINQVSQALRSGAERKTAHVFAYVCLYMSISSMICVRRLSHVLPAVIFPRFDLFLR